MHTKLVVILFSFFILASCSEQEESIQHSSSYQGISSVEDFWKTVQSDEFSTTISKAALREIAATLIFDEDGHLRGFTSEKAGLELDDVALSNFIGELLKSSNKIPVFNDKKKRETNCGAVRNMLPTPCFDQQSIADFVENCCKHAPGAANVCIVPCL